MITRYAIFEGAIREGLSEAFRAAILEEVAPKLRELPGIKTVRITFTDACDDGAPKFPLIFAIDYPNEGTLQSVLKSPERQACREALEGRVLPRFFDGIMHHHVTELHVF